jgi:hypothetical protein
VSALKANAVITPRKTFDVRPSQAPVNYDALIAQATERFPKVHAILAK